MKIPCCAKRWRGINGIEQDELGANRENYGDFDMGRARLSGWPAPWQLSHLVHLDFLKAKHVLMLRRTQASARSRYEHVYKLLACEGPEEAEKLIMRAIAAA